ncbi:MAG: hypothetical protein MUO31_05840 [Thermodesulfovibrionales bacterium]|nr:hypothetical protein [Thermodesulfovibrionales bacterium]
MNAICPFCGFDMTMKSEYERIGHEGAHLVQRLADEHQQEERAADYYHGGQVRFDAYHAKQELLQKQITARLEAALERQC